MSPAFVPTKDLPPTTSYAKANIKLDDHISSDEDEKKEDTGETGEASGETGEAGPSVEEKDKEKEAKKGWKIGHPRTDWDRPWRDPTGVADWRGHFGAKPEEFRSHFRDGRQRSTRPAVASSLGVSSLDRIPSVALEEAAMKHEFPEEEMLAEQVR